MQMATQIFGDTLYYPTAEFLAEFPSPESLKKRIIISTKPPKEFLESKSSKDKSSFSPTGSHSSEDEARGKETPDSTSEFDCDYRVRRGFVICHFPKIGIFCFVLKELEIHHRVRAIKIVKTPMLARHPNTDA